jgi:hypothetical protein
MEPINSIAPTIRAGLRALSLLLGATAIIGGGTSGQAIASPLDPAPFPKTTSASAKEVVSSRERLPRRA